MITTTKIVAPTPRSDPRRVERSVIAIRRRRRLDKAWLVDLHLDVGLEEFIHGYCAVAVEHFKRAAKLSPNNPGAHYLLGIGYKAMGRDDAAHFEWQTAANLPVFGDAWVQEMAQGLLEEYH